jgi:hypothetical protein
VKEGRHVVIGILPRFAAGARSKQHDALDARAVTRVERSAKPLYDRVIDSGGGHGGSSIYGRA